jgi:hypothetical protein
MKVQCVGRLSCSAQAFYSPVAGFPQVTVADHPAEARAYDQQFLTAHNPEKNWYAIADEACSLEIPVKRSIEEKCRAANQPESLTISLPQVQLVGPLSRQTLIFDCEARCTCARAHDCAALATPR